MGYNSGRAKKLSNPTPDQQRCLQLLIALYGGKHHLSAVYEWGSGIKMRERVLSTFDWNTLSELVFLAHDRAVRVQITDGWIILHARQREGDISPGHPTLEEAIFRYRSKYSTSQGLEIQAGNEQ
jgi:hypothetical protein